MTCPLMTSEEARGPVLVELIGADYLRETMTRVHAKARARKVLKEEVA